MHHVIFYNIKYGKNYLKLLIIVKDIIFSHVVMLFVPMANNALCTIAIYTYVVWTLA